MELLSLPQNPPFVLIKRNVAFDYLVRSQFKKVTPNSSCFLCGFKSKNHPLPSEGLPRHLYKEKVSVFRDLLINATFRKKISPPRYNKFMSGVESCSDCILIIQEVYALREQIVKLEAELEDRLEDGRAKFGNLRNGKRKIDSKSGYNKIARTNSTEYESPKFCPYNEIQTFPEIKAEIDPDFLLEDVELMPDYEMNDEVLEHVETMPTTIDNFEHQDSTIKTDSGNDLSCSSCGKTFTRKEHVKRHETKVCKIRPPSNHVVFPCKKCGKIFDTRSLLHRHEIKVCKIREPTSRKTLTLNNMKGSFPCSICAKILTTSALRVSHEIKVCNVVYSKERLDEMNIKLHYCDQCEKSFMDLYDLRRHYTTHSEVKPFSCKCGKSYGHEEYLRKHQNFLCRLGNVDPAKRMQYLQKKKLDERKRKNKNIQSSGDVSLEPLSTQIDAETTADTTSGDIGPC